MMLEEHLHSVRKLYRSDVFMLCCTFNRILKNAGLVGGGIWNFFGGARNAPKGHRLQQAIARVKARTPMLGGKEYESTRDVIEFYISFRSIHHWYCTGSFAVWGTVFSCFDCSFTYMRKKEVSNPFILLASCDRSIIH
jgi:Tim17/Tim22/Tim23/Pmp24 family